MGQFVPVSNGQYVNSGSAMTVANLLAAYPAAAGFAGMYARVSDLFNNGIVGGGVDEILRCRFDATNNAYRWVPQRSDFNADVTATGGTMTFTPLITPPTVRIVGTLTANLSIVYSPLNAWVGMKSRVIQNGTLGIFAATVNGLVGSNLTLAGNAVKDIEYIAGGYLATA